ncbi:hypothetical protein CIL03_16225 [Virgibacillus indicus]|uniref:Type I restriction modification DNA specificity domain-containing protein n=1 Tax=Virgibacillus indicus TaxID=2024554 RepID=A0A265N845_9BACI|nr:restriction endonuclease subunit S [Virgibacillus indicus]OZU87634.1 hypothetical protein CIL03_16225 [Virgibacillus indicus]
MVSNDNQLPSDWTTYKLGDIAKVSGGKRLPKGEVLTEIDNGHPYIRVANMKEKGVTLNNLLYVPDKVLESIERYKIYANELYISVAGTLGLVGEIPPILNGANLTENANRISDIKCDSKYLLYVLKSNLIQKYIEREKTISAQPKLALTRIRNFEIPVPNSRSEQKKIAAILSSVNEAIEKTEQVIEKTETVKKGLMQQSLTKGIGHENFKQTLIGDVPEEWEVVKFKDICRIANGQVDPKKEPYSDMLHIGNANIEKYTGRLLTCKTAKEEGQISGKYLFNENHVLYGKINPHFGKVTFPKFKGLCSADIYPIEADKRLLPSFLKYLLMSSRFISYTTSVSGRTGIPKVNRTDLDVFLIVVPSLEEQNKIVDIIESVETRINNNEEKVRRLYKIKQGLMQQLLTGKVRMPINDNEEVPS